MYYFWQTIFHLFDKNLKYKIMVCHNVLVFSTLLTYNSCFCFQDNVFVTVVASIQYRAIAERASDAFYKLSDTRGQIQSYVFDGIES